MPGKRNAYSVRYQDLTYKQWLRIQKDRWYSEHGSNSTRIDNRDVQSLSAMRDGKALHRKLDSWNEMHSHSLRSAALQAHRAGKSTDEEFALHLKVNSAANKAKHNSSGGSISGIKSWGDLPCSSWADMSEQHADVSQWPPLRGKADRAFKFAGTRSPSSDVGDDLESDLPTDVHVAKSSVVIISDGVSTDAIGSGGSLNEIIDGESSSAVVVHSPSVEALQEENAMLIAANRDLCIRLASLENLGAELEQWRDYASLMEQTCLQLQTFAVFPSSTSCQEDTGVQCASLAEKLTAAEDNIDSLRAYVDKMAKSLGQAVQESVNKRVADLDLLLTLQRQFDPKIQQSIEQQMSPFIEEVKTRLQKAVTLSEVRDNILPLLAKHSEQQASKFSSGNKKLQETLTDLFDSKLQEASCKSQGTLVQLRTEVSALDAKLAGLLRRAGDPQPVSKETKHSEERLPIGTAVLTHSLKTAVLNNKIGTVVSYGLDKDRYGVQFVGGSTEEAPKLLKRSNLKIGGSSTNSDKDDQDEIDDLIVGLGEGHASFGGRGSSSSSGVVGGDGFAGSGVARGWQSSSSRRKQGRDKVFFECTSLSSSLGNGDDEPWAP